MTASDWSVPETAVLDAMGDALDDQQAVVATVVAVEGSAYRRPGAKMLLPGDGDGVGSITAGCLEEEVLSLADQVLAEDESRIERFDLTGDDDVWGLGVGCNGIIDILLEPLDDRYRPIVTAYERGDDVAAVTLLDAANTGLARGDRALAFPDADGSLSFEADGWPDWLLSDLSTPTNRLLAADTSDSITVDTEGEAAEVFIDSVTAPPELIVLGNGHDVAPVVELATRVGFRVTVVSFRGADATAERYPTADRVLSTSPADIREQLAFDADTYAVLMTHNFVDDRIALEELLDTPAAYIGLLGPRDRFERIQDALSEEGKTLTDDEFDRIYTPAGLDLGGGTPHHIAQSIVAEITAVQHGRTPNHLTERRGPIHNRSPVGSDDA